MYTQVSLADLGGACQVHAPYGTQFFHFCIHFHQKVPTSEVHAPLTGACPPYGKSWIRHWVWSHVSLYVCVMVKMFVTVARHTFPSVTNVIISLLWHDVF